MKPLVEAQREVLGSLSLLPLKQVPLHDALGLVLANAVTAPYDVPPFPNSAVDGFAVRAEDVVGVPVELPVLEDVPAGSVATRPLASGTAIKVMTGAPIPAGADAVVRVEDTEMSDGLVRVMVSAPKDTAVRPAGGDIRAGAEVFSAGTRLSAVHMGVLATVGVGRPQVRRRPTVAMASTGDELRPPSPDDLAPGQINDSNRPLLHGLLSELGVEVIDLGIIPDDADLLRKALDLAAATADVVVTSGGVSMGDYDLVKVILKELGEVDFWQVAMQPAKPFAFGKLGPTPFFGLPGNPVSVMVAFEQFLRPALLAMMGADRLFRPRLTGRSRVELRTDPAKTVFVRARTWTEGEVRWAEPSGGQSSNVLSAVAAADAFAVVGEGRGTVEAGEPVTLEMFRWPEERTIDDLG
jgi:molybdopterin molybdotransferase